MHSENVMSLPALGQGVPHAVSLELLLCMYHVAKPTQKWWSYINAQHDDGFPFPQSSLPSSAG